MTAHLKIAKLYQRKFYKLYSFYLSIRYHEKLIVVGKYMMSHKYFIILKTFEKSNFYLEISLF